MKHSAKLGVYSNELSPDEISLFLGLKYDECWVKGTQISSRSKILLFQENAWFKKSDCLENELLDVHIEKLLDYACKNLDRFKILPTTCSVMINCFIDGDDNPVLDISSHLIKKMAMINAGLDIDLMIV
jgi:hypothetical protein